MSRPSNNSIGHADLLSRPEPGTSAREPDRSAGSEGAGRLIGLENRSLHRQEVRDPQAVRAGLATWVVAAVLVLAAILVAWWVLLAMNHPPTLPAVVWTAPFSLLG